MDSNPDAPVRTVALGGPQQALSAQVFADYPCDAPCLFLRHYNIPEGKTLAISHLLTEFPGFKTDVLDQNVYIRVVSIAVRTVLTKTGSHAAGALTLNASVAKELSGIMQCKSMFYRRGTDLSPGAEVHELMFHAGMGTTLLPSNLAGRTPTVVLNAGEGHVTIEIAYVRGGGAIHSTSETVQ